MSQHEQNNTSSEVLLSQESIPTKSLDLKDVGDYANVSLRETLIENQGQYPSGVSIRAQIEIGDNDRYFLATHGEMVGVLQADEKGEIVAHQILNQEENGSMPLYDDEGRYVVSLQQSPESTMVPGDVGVRIERRAMNDLNSSDIRLVTPETTRVVPGNSAEELRRDTKERRRRKIAKAFGAVAIAYSTFSSGGMIDSIADGLNDAHNTVEEVSHVVTMDSRIEGVRLGDFPDAEATINTMNRPSEAVAKTMDDLDGHRYGDIQARSDKYIANHPGEFVPIEFLQETKDRLNDSDSVGEVLNSVDSFGDYYGVTFHIDTEAGEISTDEARNTTEGIVDALSELPTSLVKDVARLKNITVTAFEDPSSERDMASLEGNYNTSKNEIKIHAQRGMVETLKDIATIPGVQSDFSVKGVFLHEFGHALDEKSQIQSGNSGVAIGGQNTGSLSLVESVTDFVRGGIAMYPESISTYARTNPEEHTAENIAGILDVDRSDGIAHPDETRRFNSPANKDMLRTLISLEKLSPGIADYLIAKNDGLMNR